MFVVHVAYWPSDTFLLYRALFGFFYDSSTKNKDVLTELPVDAKFSFPARSGDDFQVCAFTCCTIFHFAHMYLLPSCIFLPTLDSVLVPSRFAALGVLSPL